MSRFTTYRRASSTYNGFGSAVDNHQLAARQPIYPAAHGPARPSEAGKGTAKGPIEIHPITRPAKEFPTQ